ncbi:HlyD family efflux transporter periplasmic adaptor subunit [Thermocrinis jamiesonii]|jgi:Multidrug resistance efflux pump|uniref:HlyD family efflux transporter periplasmic adaptor subunit n=1 Tax=Thermocrinis jamiesonii TaxID=1302351 RepID=UPI000495D1EC|nr:HlyD family efflux transporter periplasmic adaptor subunit [Thermocrinis jamiesonii]
MKKYAGLILIGLISFVFLVYAVKWIKHRMDYAVSDAVFVKAEQMATLSFQVSGKVVEINKDLGDWVEKGEVLAKIEPEDYRLQVDALESKINSLRAQKEALQAQINRMSKELRLNLENSVLASQELLKKEEALLAQMGDLEAQIELLRKDRERLKDLLDKGLISKRRYEEVDTNYLAMLERKKALQKSIEELRLAYKRSLVGVDMAKVSLSRIAELEKQVEALKHEIMALEKQKENALRNLEYTHLEAPFSGYIAKRFINVGDVVRAGQPAFSLINPETLYVEVLLEETKLKGIKKGNKAYVRLDAYPDIVFEGEVQEISPASAATFALAPRDVSAGEFTKVVQRIPVKIKLKDKDKDMLRVGMGGRVEIKRE